MKYQTKHKEIDALQWQGERIEGLRYIAPGHGIHQEMLGLPYKGDFRWVKKGDYIIAGNDGHYYPCKKDDFEAIYEPIKGVT